MNVWSIIKAIFAALKSGLDLGGKVEDRKIVEFPIKKEKFDEEKEIRVENNKQKLINEELETKEAEAKSEVQEIKIEEKKNKKLNKIEMKKKFGKFWKIKSRKEEKKNENK